jgi:exodeoxyribonuclease VII large subunit
VLHHPTFTIPRVCTRIFAIHLQIKPLQQSFTFSSEQRVLSVTDLASGLRSLIESEFGDVIVEGELSGFKRHRSGHCYFTLKDDKSQIRCVMWRHFTQYVFFDPKDGMLVRLRGQMSVYEARGDMQFLSRSMRLAGEGALQAAFEELKEKLASEGLFDADRKKDIPRLPASIGIVTSGSGAALHDMLAVLSRRYPLATIVVCPVAVQGMGAGNEVARALDRMNDLEDRPDVIIVGRGGGSIEDLWAFNEEVVARAIARSEIPVISAVGHETDFTISDFVADYRAATPSMAAEVVAPDRIDIEAGIRGAIGRSADCLLKSIERRRAHVDRMLESRRFHRPADRLRQTVQRVDELSQRLDRASLRCLLQLRRHAVSLSDRIALLDPERPLRLGYARVEREGQLVTRAAGIHPDETVLLVFIDGKHSATITR